MSRQSKAMFITTAHMMAAVVIGITIEGIVQIEGVALTVFSVYPIVALLILRLRGK